MRKVTIPGVTRQVRRFLILKWTQQVVNCIDPDRLVTAWLTEDEWSRFVYSTADEVRRIEEQHRRFRWPNRPGRP